MKKSYRLIAIFLAIVMFIPVMSYGESLENLAIYLKNLEESQDFQGNVLLAKDGRIIFNEAYGFADKDRKIRMKKGDRHHIGSITKQFVAFSIMKLEGEGKIDLEESIDNYAIDIKAAPQISVHDLLIHSSGLVDFIDIPAAMKLELEGIQPEEVLDLIRDRDLKFKPGERYDYCNSNYLILGIIVENVSGLELGQYLRENIFDPLEMKRTGLSPISDQVKLESKSNPFMVDIGNKSEDLILTAVFGAGSMYSNAEDLFKWSEAFFKGHLLDQPGMDRILRGYKDIGTGYWKSGYGWKIRKDGLVAYHNGQTPGWTSSLTRYMDEDLTIIILTNIGQYDVNSLRDNIYGLLNNQGVQKETGHVSSDVQGEYRMKYGIPIRIYEEDGIYYGELLNLKSLRLFPVSNNVLAPMNTGVKLRFTGDEEGVKFLEIKTFGIKAGKVQ